MPGESAEYDLIRVLDSQADSKQDTFFIAPKEIGRDGSGVQVLTLSAAGEPDSPSTDQQAVFLDSTGTLKAKAPDGTVTDVSGDTLADIDGATITPAQVGTPTDRTDITADTVNTNSITGTETGGALTLTRAFASSAPGLPQVQYDTVDIDPDGNFDTANAQYVVPTDGIYQVRAVIRRSNDTSDSRFELAQNGATQVKLLNTGASGFETESLTTLIDGSAGDRLQLNNLLSTQLSGGSDDTYFEVVRLS